MRERGTEPECSQSCENVALNRMQSISALLLVSPENMYYTGVACQIHQPVDFRTRIVVNEHGHQIVVPDKQCLTTLAMVADLFHPAEPADSC